MSNADRRQARYMRRKAKREGKKLAFKEQLDNFDNIANPDALVNAAIKAQKCIRWKTSPQKYEMKLTYNVIKASEDLYNDVDIRKGFITFTLLERGKVRLITSVHFGERVIQKSLCQNVLVPILSRTLIYDNGACIKDKGIAFAMDRLEWHLKHYYNTHGNNKGKVLLIDLKNFFGSIPHDELKKRIAMELDDINLVRLACDFVDSFQGDYGIGLGSETCQIEAVFYPSPVDHFVKDQLGMEGYGRYMDDSYIIGETKEELEEIREQVISKYDELGLTVNRKKTKIVDLDSPEFKFLKNRVKLDENGAVAIIPSKESVTRMKRKLKKFKVMYDNGEMTFEQVNCAYQSWRGYMSRKDSYRILHNMDEIFKENFVIPERKRKNEENRKMQLASHPNSNRQKKRAKQKARAERKAMEIKTQVPTIKDENIDVDIRIEEKFKDGQELTHSIGRETRAYQRRKKKGKAGRKRIAKQIRELEPDNRMSMRKVRELKREVEKGKKEKEEKIMEHLSDTSK